MIVRPVKPRKILHEVVEQIRALISSGELKPGDKLPSERVLSESLQISRAAVREASSALQALGLLQVKRGEGTFIAAQQVYETSEPLANMLLTEEASPKGLLETRLIMEVAAAGLAAQRRKLMELKAMERAIKDIKIDLARGKTGEEADFQFHYAIALATNNPILFRFMHDLSQTIRDTLKSHWQFYMADQDYRLRLASEHIAIFRAIESQDAEGARQLMQQHLKHVDESLYSA